MLTEAAIRYYLYTGNLTGAFQVAFPQGVGRTRRQAFIHALREALLAGYLPLARTRDSENARIVYDALPPNIATVTAPLVVRDRVGRWGRVVLNPLGLPAPLVHQGRNDLVKSRIQLGGYVILFGSGIGSDRYWKVARIKGQTIILTPLDTALDLEEESQDYLDYYRSEVNRKAS